uniref:Si:ch211-176g6.2 n=1 Tax=Tetraodon nigroviridis TaxID=99883 RepID=H3CJK5_TETNG
ADDPSELSNHVTAPGILKIFGNEICEGAHYKSVLATTDSSAKELVKEALERYGLPKEEAQSYVLCDTIGSTGNHQWRPEGFRVVGDNERPLLLQSLWKPREGLARRFEIQRKSWVEERTSKDKDTITAGINAQARKLQKSRSRSRSPLRRRRRVAGQERDPLSEGESEKGEESEREETESSDDNTTQYSIHPPHDCPYLLLLQGCSPAQDFVVYLLAAPNISIGRYSEGEEGSKPDFCLFATDILPRHCCFQRHSNVSATTLHPGQGSLVTRNSEVLKKEAQLHPGDVIGLGQHYLFLFKDPLASADKVRRMEIKDVNSGPEPGLNAVPWILAHSAAAFSKCQESPAGHNRNLQYESSHEDCIIKEIFAMANSKGSPPKASAFLLCLCVQHSVASLHVAELRRLLLRIACGVQNTIWEHTKALAAAHFEEVDGLIQEGLQALTWQEVWVGLRPLVVWMSNSLELLQFIQFQLPLTLEDVPTDQASKEAFVKNQKTLLESCVRSASEETVAVLEEVIMLTFQQCVYYITKVLYPILPDVLDCNPFRSWGMVAWRCPLRYSVFVDILADTWRLLSDCQLHHEISSQLIGYLLFFISASLFNSLMEKGTS